MTTTTQRMPMPRIGVGRAVAAWAAAGEAARSAPEAAAARVPGDSRGLTGKLGAVLSKEALSRIPTSWLSAAAVATEAGGTTAWGAGIACSAAGPDDFAMVGGITGGTARGIAL